MTARVARGGQMMDSRSQAQKGSGLQLLHQCRDWIGRQKTEMTNHGVGDNLTSVSEAAARQHKRVKDIRDYQGQLTRTLDSKGFGRNEVASTQAALASLLSYATTQQDCLKTLGTVASLEDSFGALSRHFDQTAETLVRQLGGGPDFAAAAQPENAKASQECVTNLSHAWWWIQKLHECMQFHLRNAANYHQFHHEVSECRRWMPADLDAAIAAVAQYKPGNSHNDANMVLQAITTTLQTLLQWQTRVNSLFSRASGIVPVMMRVSPLRTEIPVKALADYSTSTISFREGDMLFLIDNKDPDRWRVRNSRGQVSDVPSIIVLIPGPQPGAVEAATAVREHFLGQWRVAARAVGKRLVSFFDLALQDWAKNEELFDEVSQLLAGLSEADKRDLQKVLSTIQTVLGREFAADPEFRSLQEKLARLHRGLANPGSGNNGSNPSLVIQVRTLDQLIKRYQDFMTYYVTFDLSVTTTRVSTEKFIRLDTKKFVSSAYIYRFRPENFTNPAVSPERAVLVICECQRTDDVDAKQLHMRHMHESMSQETAFEQTSEMNGGYQEESATVDEETKEERAETSEIIQTAVEEKKTFTISAVIDPSSGKELSIQDAVDKGIIDQERGLYVNPKTKASMPIPQAMNDGKILVEFTRTKRGKEETKSIGLITIHTKRDHRPFTILTIRDVKGKRDLTPKQAHAASILHEESGMFVNTQTENEILIADAIDEGLIEVRWGSGEGEEREVVKTYAIHGVVDQRKRKVVDFRAAVQTGLLDTETGAYINNNTWEEIYVGDAIMKGFIKAKVVKDPKSLDIDPENRVVIKRMQNLKNKLKAFVAFKGAAKAGGPASVFAKK